MTHPAPHDEQTETELDELLNELTAEVAVAIATGKVISGSMEARNKAKKTLEAWSRQQTAQVLDSLIKTDAHTFTVGAIKAARAGLYRHTGGNDIISERPDDNSEVVESPTAPAEALRQQLYENCRSYTALAYPINRQIDELMELVTAYAATVEREAYEESLNLWKGWLAYVESGCGHINRRQIKEMIAELDDRLAALQGPQDTTQ